MKTIADLTQNDVERILGIVDRLNDIEVRIETEGMKLHVRKFGDPSLAAAAHAAPAAPALEAPAKPSLPARPMPTEPQPAAPAASLHAQAAPARAAAEAGLLEVRAPMLGRFFRASSPSEPPYVHVGSKIGPDDTVCMIEVMKLFNTVKAGVSGTVVEVLAENGAMIEYDAVLFRVRPE